MPPLPPKNSQPSSGTATIADPAKAVTLALTNLNSAIHAYISQSPKKDAARRRCVKQVYHLLGRLLEE